MPDGKFMKNSRVKTAHKTSGKVPKKFHFLLESIGKTMREQGLEKPVRHTRGTGKFMHLKKGTTHTKAFMAHLRSLRK